MAKRRDSELPDDERRKLGAHYTPPDLAATVVARALEPHLMRLPSWQDRRGALRVCDPAMGDGVFLVEALRQMSRCFAERSGHSPDDLRIKRFIADELLFGVDVDPGAVEATRDALSREIDQHVDPHHFVVGDSLVGPMMLAPDRVAGLKKPDFYDQSWRDEQEWDWTLGGAVSAPHDWSKWPHMTCWIGNPPFMGGGKISGTLGEAYKQHLKGTIDAWHGNADLCAAFFRRCAYLVPPQLPTTISFIATNTISQGDTRHAGLYWLLRHGWTIYDAVKSMPWPGDAKVHVAIVHMFQTDQWGKVDNDLQCKCGWNKEEVANVFLHDDIKTKKKRAGDASKPQGRAEQLSML